MTSAFVAAIIHHMCIHISMYEERQEKKNNLENERPIFYSSALRSRGGRGRTSRCFQHNQRDGARSALNAPLVAMHAYLPRVLCPIEEGVDACACVRLSCNAVESYASGFHWNDCAVVPRCTKVTSHAAEVLFAKRVRFSDTSK